MDIESHWKLCANVITCVATECIGHSEKRVKFGWRDDEYDKLLPKKEKPIRNTSRGTLVATVRNTETKRGRLQNYKGRRNVTTKKKKSKNWRF